MHPGKRVNILDMDDELDTYANLNLQSKKLPVKSSNTNQQSGKVNQSGSKNTTSKGNFKIVIDNFSREKTDQGK